MGRKEPRDLTMYKWHQTFSLRWGVRGAGAEEILQNAYWKFGPCFLQKHKLYTLKPISSIFLKFGSFFYLIYQSLKCHLPCSLQRFKPEFLETRGAAFHGRAGQGSSCSAASAWGAGARNSGYRCRCCGLQHIHLSGSPSGKHEINLWKAEGKSPLE